ncbi:MAG: acyltransferase [Tissierellia bacterium]|nr:acyltransferase [Tissierellia bacterium]
MHRYLMMLRLLFIKSPMKRAAYMKKAGVFKSCGDRVMITSRKVPLYSRLISIGNNVWMASGVEFVTHDVVHFMLNGLKDGTKYQEKIGCIEIGDNVFIGSSTKILYDVKIGDNVVIAAGSIVNKDIPSNSIVAGIPARRVGDFDTFVKKRRLFELKSTPNNHKQNLPIEAEEEVWEKFYRDRQSI